MAPLPPAIHVAPLSSQPARPPAPPLPDPTGFSPQLTEMPVRDQVTTRSLKAVVTPVLSRRDHSAHIDDPCDCPSASPSSW